MPSTDMSLTSLPRQVLPERLDQLAAEDRRARRSRRDLQRIHRVMRSLAILRRAIASLSLPSPPRTILELGAGDGSLMLRLARLQHPHWCGVQVTFLDRHDVISQDTCSQFERLGWQPQRLTTDALDWAAATPAQSFDLCVTTLFLHHFQPVDLRLLLGAVAIRSRALIALEPRRSRAAWIGSHLLGFLGANEITREDGVKSVVAGFIDHELTSLWPSEPAGWQLREYSAWPFTHCLVAGRLGAAATAAAVLSQ